MDLQEALDNFRKAREEVDKYVTLFKIERDEDFFLFKCPTCGKEHYRGIMTDPEFTHIIICCDHILVKEK